MTHQQPPVDAAATRWQIAPGWNDVLLGPGGLRLEQWLRDGQAHVVKNGEHRTVYRVDAGGRTLFVKHYRTPRLLARMRHLLRASASRREWDKTVAVAGRRIPTARPVAWGEQHRGGLVADNYFITEGIPQARPLEEFAVEALPRLPRAAQARVRRRLILALAQLAADVHRAGVFHRDFHAGNVLLQVSESDAAVEYASPRLFLIDLPSVTISRPLNWARSRDNLVMLGAAWFNRLSRGDRWRFWQTYLAARPDLQLADARRAASDLDLRTRAHARRILRSRDKRCLRSNRDFYALTTASGSAHAVGDVPREVVLGLLSDPAAPLREFRHSPVKLSHSSVVVEATLPLADGSLLPIAYKRSRLQGWFKRAISRWRPSRALRNWRLGHALLSRGIATARPLAVVDPAGFNWRDESFLATEWLAGAENLHVFAWRIAALTPHERRQRVRQTAESLGRLIGRLHAWHIGHRDLKGCNLVIVQSPDDVQSFLIDLDGMEIRRSMPDCVREQNLARLAVSLQLHPWIERTARLRFLRAYLRETVEARGDWKSLWRRVAVPSQAIEAELRRRGRPIA